VLDGVADELIADLESFAGVRDAHDDLELGEPGWVFTVKDEARLLGVDETWLGTELRTAFEGLRYGQVRRGRDDVELIVKLPEELRADPAALTELRVSLPTGARVPLATVAELRPELGPMTIRRDERERAVRVVADVDKRQGSSAAIVAAVRELYADLPERHPGYRLTFKGDQEELEDSVAGIERAVVMSLALIFLILGSLFRSVSQPLVIMFVIPFGMVGMVLGHVLMGRSIGLMSLIGLLALTGVVVNDSLILVDFVNQRRREGAGLMAALVEAGRLRFRPILLTSITTMLGLAPLTFFVTGQARFLQPMAISLFFGLGTATALVLVLVPCAYAILEDALALLRRPRKVLARLRRGETVHA
jgi:multidrug efflux pump subunit AcrB